MDTRRIAMVGLLAIGTAVALRAAATHHARKPLPPAPVPASAPARPPQPRRPAMFGVNLNSLHNWTNERAFANLAKTEYWRFTTATWPAFDPARIGPGDVVLSLRPGEQAAAPLAYPAAAQTGDVRVRCTWTGNGDAEPFGGRDVARKGQSFDFTFPRKTMVAFLITRTDPANPIRAIDCREPGLDPQARFDPAFLESLKPYKVVRFQGWSTVNLNTGGDWSRRTLPTGLFVSGPDGVPVEDMVALCNQAGVDPWFTMDWKADATYMANFARYVHEHLDPSRTVYVEIGNEVWNWSFNNSHFALDEGKARGLDPNGNGDVARMRRYAEHAVEGFTVWNREYGADRGRLVRVLGGHSVWPDFLKLALDYKDTAHQIDAIAMAPYFGADFFSDANRPTGDLDVVFRELTAKVDDAVKYMREDKKLADSYGLRLIAYEAGQHLIYNGPDKTLLARIARDPRMETLYARYLDGWKREAGDLMMMFTNIDPAGPSTDWGMVEYYGQPRAETPKLRALLAAEGAPR